MSSGYCFLVKTLAGNNVRHFKIKMEIMVYHHVVSCLYFTFLFLFSSSLNFAIFTEIGTQKIILRQFLCVFAININFRLSITSFTL